jgi:hypothetical protein
VRIPIADASGLGPGLRRAWIIRLLLAAALASLLVGAFVTVPGGAARSAHRSGRTMVVLDVSGSIEGNDFPAVGRALERAAQEAGPSGAGLVLFSDSAQEALPPGTPQRELLRFLRFFSSRARTAQSESGFTLRHRPGSQPSGPQPAFAALNPWQPHFSAGTAISVGIERARAALGNRGRIILISDFVDSTWDRSALKRQLLAIARTPGLELQPMPLPAVLPGSATPYLKLIDRSLPSTKAAAGSAAAERAQFPRWLVAVAALLAAALAVNELMAVSLRFREARA